MRNADAVTCSFVNECLSDEPFFWIAKLQFCYLNEMHWLSFVLLVSLRHEVIQVDVLCSHHIMLNHIGSVSFAPVLLTGSCRISAFL